MKVGHTYGKKWPEKVAQRTFIKGHSFPNSLYIHTISYFSRYQKYEVAYLSCFISKISKKERKKFVKLLLASYLYFLLLQMFNIGNLIFDVIRHL